MQANLLKMTWVFIIASSSAAFLLLFKEHQSSEVILAVLIFLFVFTLAGFAYITLRILFFRKHIVSFLKHLWAGDYEIGVKISAMFQDEFEFIATMMNKAADRLRTYDVLRSQSVALNQRAMDIIYSDSKDGIILANIDKRQFKFNPTAQSVFGVEQESVSFSLIEKQAENSEFIDFFKLVTERERVPQEKKVTLRLPIKHSERELLLKIIPLKDKHEKTRIALIFIRKAGTQGRNILAS